MGPALIEQRLAFIHIQVAAALRAPGAKIRGPQLRHLQGTLLPSSLCNLIDVFKFDGLVKIIIIFCSKLLLPRLLSSAHRRALRRVGSFLLQAMSALTFTPGWQLNFVYLITVQGLAGPGFGFFLRIWLFVIALRLANLFPPLIDLHQALLDYIAVIRPGFFGLVLILVPHIAHAWSGFLHFSLILRVRVGVLSQVIFRHLRIGILALGSIGAAENVSQGILGRYTGTGLAGKLLNRNRNTQFLGAQVVGVKTLNVAFRQLGRGRHLLL